jgi:peptidoglycan/LPS O-acetylase OafA/YrhL
LISTLILSKLKVLSLFNSDLLISLTVSYLIVVCPKINLDQNKVTKSIRNAFIYLSNISYTLYLIHFPICMFIFCYIIKFEKIYLNLASFFSYLFFLSIIIFIAYLFWFMFERNTNLIRGLIYKKIF